MSRRRLPQNELVQDLRHALWSGYIEGVQKFPDKDAKRELLRIACGHCEDFPFAEDLIARTRAPVRAVLKRAGYGEGHPRPSDRPQRFEVRLVGELARACGDPDAQFTELWPRGVYVGSKGRILPRTPATFERKLKWRLGDLDPLVQPEWRAKLLIDDEPCGEGPQEVRR